MRDRSDHDPGMKPSFSRSPWAFCIEKCNISRSGDHSKFHAMLHLPRKVTLELHQILRLPRKVTLERHQILRLPPKVTLERHQICAPATKSDSTLLYSTLLFSTSLLTNLFGNLESILLRNLTNLISYESILRRIYSQTNLMSNESILLRIYSQTNLFSYESNLLRNLTNLFSNESILKRFYSLTNLFSNESILLLFGSRSYIGSFSSKLPLKSFEYITQNLRVLWLFTVSPCRILSPPSSC